MIFKKKNLKDFALEQICYLEPLSTYMYSIEYYEIIIFDRDKFHLSLNWEFWLKHFWRQIFMSLEFEIV